MEKDIEVKTRAKKKYKTVPTKSFWIMFEAENESIGHDAADVFIKETETDTLKVPEFEVLSEGLNPNQCKRRNKN